MSVLGSVRLRLNRNHHNTVARHLCGELAAQLAQILTHPEITHAS